MRSFRIGSVLGIPIKLDLTFLLILPVYAYLIGSQVGATAEALNMVWGLGIDTSALTGGGLEWVIGLVAALGLFVGVVLHELGHSVTAMRFGYPIDSITLWIFGGIASLSEMPEDWKQEFLIAIAGPIVSVLLGVGAYVALFVLPGGLDAVVFVVGYLALLNLTLAVFNMLPGFPMDGGRVLRALLTIRFPYAKATQYAAEVGKLFAILLGIVGLFSNWLLIGLAFFIYIGASSEAQQTMMKAAFEGVSVGDVMTPADELDTVQADATVADLIRRMIREHHTGYPVMDGDRFVGVVTLEDARGVRQEEREAFLVSDVMTGSLTTVTPDTDPMTAITLMQKSGVGRLPVVEDDDLVGLISRSDLMTAFEIIRSSQPLKPREGVGKPGGPGAKADPESEPFRPGK